MIKKDCNEEYYWHDRCGRDKKKKKRSSGRTIINAFKLIHSERRETERLFGIDCGSNEAKSSEIMELLRLFHAENIHIELSAVETYSPLCQSFENRSIKHVMLTGLPPEEDEYCDIIITEHFGENLVELFDEIIESNPRSLIIYPADSSFEQILYHFDKYHSLNKGQKPISSYILVISFDESYFTVTFDTELYSKTEMVSIIEKVFTS